MGRLLFGVSLLPFGTANVDFAVEAGDCTVADSCVMSPNYPNDYGNDQSCDVEVTGHGTVSAMDFDTEFGMDTLTIGDDSFSGAHRPDHVTVQHSADISWTSDYSNPASGWKICSDSPAASPGGGAVAGLTVTSGHCTVEGSCASSPHYPQDYGSNEQCTVSVVGGNGILNSEAFNTEAGLDELTIGGSDRYSGTDGPEGVYVSAGEDIIWQTDYSIQSSGWRLCVSNVSPPLPPSGVFSVVSGECILNGDCVQSPRFPRNYGNDKDCRVRLESDGTLRSEVFHLEDYGYDYVSVGGTHYSGDQGPDGMYVLNGMTLGFHSDSSNTYTGFSICLRPEEAEHVTPAPEPAGIKSVGEVYCEHGCSNLTMLGSPTGYVITHSSVSDSSEGSVVIITGQCQVVFTRVNLAGGTLQLDGSSVEGPTARLVGPGNHTLVWVGGGSTENAEWLAMILPTRGGCSEFSSDFDTSCDAGGGTHKIFHTETLDDADRCLEHCRQYSSGHLEPLCCQFGFRDDKLGCYAVEGGATVFEHGLGRAAQCSPQVPAAGEAAPGLQAAQVEAFAAAVEQSLAAAAPRPKTASEPAVFAKSKGLAQGSLVPALGAVALLASAGAFVATVVSKRAGGRGRASEPLLSGA